MKDIISCATLSLRHAYSINKNIFTVFKFSLCSHVNPAKFYKQKKPALYCTGLHFDVSAPDSIFTCQLPPSP